MPALPAVPGVVKVAHEGTVAGEPWATISHWRYVTDSGPLTDTQLATAMAKFVNAWRDDIKPHTSSACIDSQVVGTDLTTSTSAVGVALDGDAGDAGGLVSPESCYLVSKKVGRRYRGGHPRTYWPGVSPGFTAGALGRIIEPTNYAAIQAGFQAYYADIPPAITTDGATNISSWHEVQVSYHSGGVLRPVPVVDDILSQNVEQALATQRRRMHRA